MSKIKCVKVGERFFTDNGNFIFLRVLEQDGFLDVIPFDDYTDEEVKRLKELTGVYNRNI